MTYCVKVARCKCGARNVWPDGCHHWTATCTCGWQDEDADDQPGAIEAAYEHLAEHLASHYEITCHVCGPEPCDQSLHPEQQDQPSRSLTAPHSDSLDRDRAADIYDPLRTAHNESREGC